MAKAAEKAGVDRIVVDLEQRGKAERQHGYHLECNYNSVDDVKKIKTAVNLPVVCRLNPMHIESKDEIEKVIAAGADIIMLPMFQRAEEVKKFIDIVNHRAVTCLLIETREAVEAAAEIAQMDFDEFYIGLNDLALSYGKKFCYEFFLDDTLAGLKEKLGPRPFGLGGITVVDKGSPLPTVYILQEMARLNAGSIILRRAFKRDVRGRDMLEEVLKIRKEYEKDLGRSAELIRQDHDKVIRELGKMCGLVQTGN